ncbi:uncharacterized protein LOC120092526 isoform X2 [Benincasa hispida]|uniref:uncharacterized protein LOC120092526 isoform X2 n=1 Tax=Benincasa hispida TaxID=102211 RepID=UPI00190086AB|nr:uncharacterized protein LOC120092526 isoform X2 [Benincasa hispida]
MEVCSSIHLYLSSIVEVCCGSSIHSSIRSPFVIDLASVSSLVNQIHFSAGHFPFFSSTDHPTDKLLQEMEQSREARSANINKLKNQSSSESNSSRNVVEKAGFWWMVGF